MKHLISIIIPAYNAEKRIEKTIHRLERQTYHEFEAIIVDDGSSDKTGSLCDLLAKQYQNIKVLHESNVGPGKARENGIHIAQGDIIAFLDSDDYYSDRALEILISKLDETDADIIQFGYKKITDRGDLISEHPLKECSFETNKEAFIDFITNTGFLWNRIFKRSLFYNVNWPSLYHSEDYAALAQLYGKVRKAVTIEDQVYYYVQHSDSASHLPFTERNLDQIAAGEYVVQYTGIKYPDFLPEALFYLATRSARICEQAMGSSLNNKKEIVNSTLKTFRRSYSEMKQTLKQQGRALKLDKMTKMFAASPTLTLLLKKMMNKSW